MTILRCAFRWRSLLVIVLDVICVLDWLFRFIFKFSICKFNTRRCNFQCVCCVCHFAHDRDRLCDLSVQPEPPTYIDQCDVKPWPAFGDDGDRIWSTLLVRYLSLADVLLLRRLNAYCCGFPVIVCARVLSSPMTVNSASGLCLRVSCIGNWRVTTVLWYCARQMAFCLSGPRCVTCSKMEWMLISKHSRITVCCYLPWWSRCHVA